jgi:hypothetical protein
MITFGAAEDYERGRPGWPAGAVAALVERSGARTVLDLAAGTGKLTVVLDAAIGFTAMITSASMAESRATTAQSGSGDG